MNVTQLKYLHAVISEGSYAKAAQRLFVTPQAVSKSLRSLEEELGFPLFERSGRSVVPTELGRAFSDRADDTLARFDDLAVYALGCLPALTMPRSITLGIATAPYRCRLFTPEDFAPFHAAHPACELTIRTLPNEPCVSALKAGLFDAAIVQGGVDKSDIACRQVSTLHPCAVMKRSHVLAGRKSLFLGDLDGQHVALPHDVRCLMSELAKKCAVRHASPEFVDIAPTLEAGKGFLAAGGIILVARENRFEHLSEEAACVPFDPSEEFRIALNLAYPSEKAEAMAPLYAFAVNLARKRSEEAR